MTENILTLVFPIGDIRAFLPQDHHRLSRPAWPNPSALDGDYVRYFGPICDRTTDYWGEWVGENTYCDAHHAFTFDGSLSALSDRSRKFLAEDITVLRRFFGGTGIATRLEVTFLFDINLQGIPRTEEVQQYYWELIRQLAGYPVQASERASADGEAPLPLAGVGPVMATRYLNGTTASEYLGEANRLWTGSGAPLMYIGTTDESLPSFENPEAQRIDDWAADGLHLYYGKRRIGSSPTHFWFARHDESAYENDLMRDLRINLIRMHAEKEGLKLVLERLRSGLIPLQEGHPATRRLTDYLVDMTGKLLRPQTGEESTTEQSLLAYAFAQDHLSHPGEVRELEHQLRQVSGSHTLLQQLNQLVEQQESLHRERRQEAEDALSLLRRRMKELVAEGKAEKLLEKEVYLAAADSQTQNDLILLSGQFKSEYRQFLLRRGLESDRCYHQIQGQISQALMFLIDEFEPCIPPEEVLERLG